MISRRLLTAALRKVVVGYASEPDSLCNGKAFWGFIVAAAFVQTAGWLIFFSGFGGSL
jgi:hypothetical protein